MQFIMGIIALIISITLTIIWAVWCLIKTIVCIPLIIYYMATQKKDV